MKDQKPSTPFVPYADETEVLRIGDLEIGNRIDHVTLTGDLVLTKDQAGLALAKELKTVVDHIVKALEADKALPQVVEVKPAVTVKNPFA
ncbi:MAG: hypothetical protein ABIR55_03425 [Burkholderiaceae bacterium]